MPDADHEAMRDLVRARAAAVRALRRSRQQLSGFLLRHGVVRPGKNWTMAHRRWLSTIRFDHPTSQIVLQDYIHAVEDAGARRDRLTGQIEELLDDWSMAPVVKALQAMRGIALIVAVTLVAELGDLTRFDNPRRLMAYLGLVPSEHSSGESVRRGGITRAGNGEARRVEAAWTYRLPAQGYRPSASSDCRGCPRRCAISPGRPKSGYARATVGYARLASRPIWSTPPSPARCSASPGLLPSMSSRARRAEPGCAKRT